MNKHASLAVILTLCASSCLGALLGTTVMEVRTTGADTNSGGWVPGSSGTDLSQSNTPTYAVTDAVSNGTTTVTSATAAFGTNVVGNLLYFQGGTGGIAAGWYQIITRTSATALVLDRTIVASTGATLNIGGALDHPSRAALLNGSLGMDIWVKAGTYNITNVGGGTYGGKILCTGTAANPAYWEGYQTTRGDRGTKPVFLATTLGTGNVIMECFHAVATNIEVDGANIGSVDGFNCTDNFRTVLCTARRCLGTGFNNTNADRCYAVSCNNGFQVNPTTFACIAQSSVTNGYIGVWRMIRCIDIGAPNPFKINSNGYAAINCVSYGGASTGAFQMSAANTWCVNCIAINRTGAGGVGFTGLTAFDTFTMNCAGYNNAGGNTDATDPKRLDGFITLTADPFTNAAGGDFSLNAVSGGGALLRALGVPGVFPNALTTSYANVGAAENSAPVVAAGTSSVFIQ